MGSMFDCSNNWDLRPYMTTKLPAYKYIKKFYFHIRVYGEPQSLCLLSTFQRLRTMHIYRRMLTT